LLDVLCGITVQLTLERFYLDAFVKRHCDKPVYNCFSFVLECIGGDPCDLLYIHIHSCVCVCVRVCVCLGVHIDVYVCVHVCACEWVGVVLECVGGLPCNLLHIHIIYIYI